LSIFAFQNKKLIEPWIESFRKFGQFSDSEKPKATKSLPLDLSKQEKKESQLTSFSKKEFTLQLSPVDLNSSLENNKSFIFKARIIEK
jgi:hypothetical protein